MGFFKLSGRVAIIALTGACLAQATEQRYITALCSLGFAELNEWPKVFGGQKPLAVIDARNGRLAIARESSHDIEIWSGSATPESKSHLAQTLQGHDSPIKSLKIHPSENILLSVDENGKTLAWYPPSPAASFEQVEITHTADKPIRAGFSNVGGHFWVQGHQGRVSLGRFQVKHHPREERASLEIAGQSMSAVHHYVDTELLPQISGVMQPSFVPRDAPTVSPTTSLKARRIFEGINNRLVVGRFNSKGKLKENYTIELWPLDEGRIKSLSADTTGQVLAILRDDGHVFMMEYGDILGAFKVSPNTTHIEISQSSAKSPMMALYENDGHISIISWKQAARTSEPKPLFRMRMGVHDLDPPIFTGGRRGLR